MKLYIHRFLARTRAEGPGERACIWVQGCPIRCSGCAVPWTWSKTGGEEIEVEVLAERIRNGPRIEGVTFAGGEPFAQAEALAELGERLQAQGLSIMTYTGYTLETIRSQQRSGWSKLLALSDILVDGPFQQELKNSGRGWTGSSNQRVHFLTSRYKDWEKDREQIRNKLEMRIQPDGRIEVCGVPDMERLELLLKQLEMKKEGG